MTGVANIPSAPSAVAAINLSMRSGTPVIAPIWSTHARFGQGYLALQATLTVLTQTPPFLSCSPNLG